VVAQGILGGRLAQATASPLADAAGLSLGGWARLLVLWGATVSTFGHLGGMTLAISRIVFALASDGYLPRVLASVHHARRVPHVAIVAQAVLAFALAASGTFEQLASLGNVSALALYLGCAAAAWKLGGRVVVPVLASLVIAWLLTGLTRSEWLAFGICLGLATVAYGVRARTTTQRS
jgi:amino acid transporter